MNYKLTDQIKGATQEIRAMNKPHILVQYQGGGYDGCFWEWNFCLVDSVENPTQFEDAGSSGSNGIQTIEEFKDREIGEEFYYNIMLEKDWKVFDREANPVHVLGVVYYLLDNYGEWVSCNQSSLNYIGVYCDECGEIIDLELYGEDREGVSHYSGVVLSDWRGNGGIDREAGSKLCSQCNEKLEWEGWIRDQIISDLGNIGIFVDLETCDIDRILYHAMGESNVCLEGEGDDLHLYPYADLIDYVQEHKDTIRKDALNLDDQMKFNLKGYTMKNDLRYFWGNYGTELAMTLGEAESGSHQGECYQDVLELADFPTVQEQLSKIDPETLIEELLEYGAWGKEDLQDHDENLIKILWIACGDIVENEPNTGSTKDQ